MDKRFSKEFASIASRRMKKAWKPGGPRRLAQEKRRELGKVRSDKGLEGSRSYLGYKANVVTRRYNFLLDALMKYKVHETKTDMFFVIPRRDMK